MYRVNQPLQRIDQQVIHYPTHLYQPLRKTLLKPNLSQSNISSRSYLSVSRVDDLSISRVSRRMKSLSPQQAQNIRNNTFIPISKRLVPTKNLYLVKDKKFQAINLQQRVYKPIPAIKFNSLNRFSLNKVQEVIYQPEDQLNSPIKTNNYQYSNMQCSFGPDQRQQSRYVPQQTNIYTSRTNNFVNRNNSFISKIGVSQGRQYSPRQTYNLGIDGRMMTDTFGRNRMMSPPPQDHVTFQNSLIDPVPNASNNHSMSSTMSYPQNLYNRTSFQQATIHSTNKPMVTSAAYNDGTSGANFYTSESNNNKLRELPTQHTLNFVGSPMNSHTSFEPELQKQRPVNIQNSRQSNQMRKSYDFSRLTQDSLSSEYKQKKKQDIFDQPLNTKCSKTGCFKNQILASQPNLYEWQQ